MAICPTSFFQAKQARGNVFYDIQERKTPFQAIKIRSSKSRRIAIFLNGLIHGFWTKMAFLTTSFYFSKIGHENVFCDILEKKNAFLGYKKKKFKRPKNCDFSKGVNPWFWYKNGHFSNSFFRQNRPGKCLLRYSRTKKKCLSRL